MMVSLTSLHSTFHTEIVSVVTGGSVMVVTVVIETNTVVVMPWIVSTVVHISRIVDVIGG